MSKKTFYSFISFILVIVLLAGAWGIGWKVTGEMNPVKWVQSQKQPDNPGNNDNTGDKRLSNFKLTTDGDNEIMLLSATLMSAPVAQAEDSYTLTATINPLHADVQTVEWSVEFVNGSSEWASGKTVTDYVTVTADEANGLVARVDCKAPFGEQVKVRVTSTENREAYADCICDYVQRVQNLVFSGLLDFPASSFTYSYDTTAYTLPADISVEFNCFTLDKAFEQYFYNYRNYGGRDFGLVDNVDFSLYSGCPLDVDTANNTLSLRSTYKDFAHIFVVFMGDAGSEDGTPIPSDFYDIVNANFRLAVKSYGGTQGYIETNFTSSYNGVTYGVFNGDAPIKFNYDSIRVPVVSVSLDNNHIIY